MKPESLLCDALNSACWADVLSLRSPSELVESKLSLFGTRDHRLRKAILKFFRLRRLFLISLMGMLCFGSSSILAASRPNILLIMADDLGFSDLGCYGGEIKTPNLDGLAQDGLKWTQFYNTARCWPSRAAAMTGFYPQQIRRDTFPGTKLGSRPKWAPLISQRLQSVGYRTYHSGKWHIDGQPLQNGFHHSYSLNDHDRHFSPKLHTKDDKALPAAGASSGYYSTKAIGDYGLEFLRDHASNHIDKPYFLFLAFTAPHFPVQAPQETIERYRPTYSAGWDKLREWRGERLRSLGVYSGVLSLIEREIGPPYHFPEALKRLGTNEINRPLIWTDLSPDQQRYQVGKMATHAAMVDLMDAAIGKVVNQLKASGLYENTLILFVSDNGASAEMMVRGDGNDIDALCGTGATFLSIGPGWSSLANTPFRRHKTWVHEGGIATPFIAHWPKGISKKGEILKDPAHLIDITPSILELAGVVSSGQGGEAQHPYPGRSLVAELKGPSKSPASVSYWWLHEGNRALRQGKYKIVADAKATKWELYDLNVDRAEQNNLASQLPEKVMSMAMEWETRSQSYQKDSLSE